MVVDLGSEGRGIRELGGKQVKKTIIIIIRK